MLLAPRKLALLAVCGVALACTACGSNNKGKIVGKWKIVSGAGMEEQAKALEGEQAYMYIEYKPDDTLVMGLDSTNPASKEMVAKGGNMTFPLGKYRLLSGDGVEYYDIPKDLQQKAGGGGLFGGGKDRARTNIKIDGDNMTMTDSDGKSAKLVRVK